MASKLLLKITLLLAFSGLIFVPLKALAALPAQKTFTTTDVAGIAAYQKTCQDQGGQMNSQSTGINGVVETCVAKTTAPAATTSDPTSSANCSASGANDGISVTTSIGSFCSIGDFVAAAVSRYVLPLATVAALVVITYAGFQYITSGGTPDTVNQAKELIIGAILGLLVILVLGFFLRVILPADEIGTTTPTTTTSGPLGQ